MVEEAESHPAFMKSEATKPTRALVFTDGSSKGNPGPGGWGAVVLTADDLVTELGGSSAQTTNNRMELSGAIEALRFLRPAKGPIDIYTDSTYLIRGITEWIFEWKRRGWKTTDRRDVVNRDLWEKFIGLVSERGRAGAVAWHYVRGHSNVPGNERADAIAGQHATGKKGPLYRGSLEHYGVPVRSLPKDDRLPPRSVRSSSASRRRAAYSYLSVVGGEPMRHANWSDCERRVKGQPGARFKKTLNAQDETEILKGWGLSPSDIVSS